MYNSNHQNVGMIRRNNETSATANSSNSSIHDDKYNNQNSKSLLSSHSYSSHSYSYSNNKIKVNKNSKSYLTKLIYKTCIILVVLIFFVSILRVYLFVL